MARSPALPFPPGSKLAALLDAPLRPGRVTWIGLRPSRRAPMRAIDVAVLRPGTGLDGDRYSGGGAGTREVTLIAAEHLAAIGAFLGRPAARPEDLRRNIVVEGVNLLALKGRRFRLGDALLEMTGECHPCSRMEEALGTGGYNAVRGHGGITARVLAGGEVRLGDPLYREADAPGQVACDRPDRSRSSA